MSKHGNFHESVSKLLVERLTKYKDKSLNKETCISIYSTIFESLQEVFVSSEAKISNESLNWIAQSYYDSVAINNTQELDPQIFTHRASLEKIETKELALLAVMLKGTPYVVPIINTIKKRS
jgi:hypothetical protein